MMRTIAQAKFTRQAIGSSRPNKSRALPPSLSSTQSASDLALIKSIADGDKDAMQELYVRHNVRVYRFVLCLMRDTSVAEDIVSDVFLDVWRQADGFEAKSRVSTWLLAIARYKAISELRRHADEQLNERAVASIEDPSDDPEIAMQKQGRTAIVRKCLTQLSRAHREVMDLIYYHDRSVDEVAKIIGIPTSTVKTRMFYARSRLAESLRQAGVDGL